MKKILIVLMLLCLSSCKQEDVYTKAEVDALVDAKVSELEETYSENNEVDLTDLTNVYSDVIKEVYGSVFIVESYDTTGQNISIGSACIFSKDEKYYYLFTNYHVIADSSMVKLRINHENKNIDYFDTEIVGSSPGCDLAVLKLAIADLDYTPQVCDFADVNDLELGDLVLAIGTPISREYYNTCSSGIISGLNRRQYLGTDTDDPQLMKLVQHDCPINHGNSGGPLFNMDGEVVGINTIKLVVDDSEGLGFAISCDYAKRVLYDLLDDGVYTPNEIGVMISIYSVDTGVSDVAGGIQVSEVFADSAASETTDLQAGDIIYKVNGTDIENIYTLKDIIFAKNSGDRIVINYIRNGEKRETTLILGEYGENSENN